MTLNTNVGRNEYTATSSQTIFNYTFKIFDSTDLDVFVTPAGQECTSGDLTTNYTVSGVGDESGGAITLATPTTTGDLVTIVSSIPSSRTTDYQNNGDFRADTVNDDFDRVLSIAKQATDLANRAVLFPDCLQGVTALTLPSPESERFVRWKDDLSGLENTSPPSATVTTVTTVSVRDYTSLRALTGQTADEVISVGYRSTENDSGGGAFRWDDSDLSTQVTADTQSGIYVAPDSDSSGTSGAWVRAGLIQAVNAAWYGVDGTGDDFTAVQAAAASGFSVIISTSMSISDEIVLTTNNQSIILHSSVIITQTTINKAVFKSTGLDNVWIHCNGATLFGEGTWSILWTGNSGHNDRVVQFITCTNSGITNPIIKNGANAGLSIEGCTSFAGINLIIEGTTNNGGVPLSGLDPNFQNGIYIKHSPTNGDCKDIYCSFDISGTAQGVLVEAYAAYTGQGNQIRLDGFPHDIIGQHGIYCQAGDVTVNVNVRNTNLTAVKIQANAAGHQLKNFILNINAQDISSHALELQDANGSAEISNVVANVVCRNVQRGIGINANVKNVKATVICEDSTQYGAILQGTGLEDIDLNITTEASGRHGVYVTASDCTNINIWAKVRQANTTAGAFDGIHVETAGDVIFHNPDATDSDTNQRHGFFISDATALIKVMGSARFTGAATSSARSDAVLVEWPSDITLDGTTQTQLTNLGNFGTSLHMNRVSAQSTSGSAVTLWQIPLDDESAYEVTATIVGKLADSSERGTKTTSVLFFRDGGGSATKQGADTDIVNRVSGSFAGVIVWEGSGNNARIRVNSGGAATYDWEARVICTRVT